MEIEDLRTFVEVADAGGVTPASRRLGISKSMVSRRLVRLEAELSVQLLARTTRGAALTEAGATFREYAARVVAEIDLAKETVLPAGELRGRLRVAAPLSFGPTHFAPVLADMARRYPELHIHAAYTDRFVDLIAEGYDCAIRVGMLPDSNLIARRIGPLIGKYVASPAYIEKCGSPETPEELVTHQALMQGTETWLATVGDKVITMRPQGRFKADNGVALIAAAVAGIGIAALPNDLIQEHLDSGALVQVMPHHPIPEHGIYVVRPPGQHPSRKVRVLTEMLIECFGRSTEGTKALST
ncbi:LysR family transcriptional regulator [Paraburkholderia sp. DD10]|jgi:DNA-binding transcriptional LysR family regulator|uniref:DNA-binding transcriptional regulator, LysR family n=2 Tax=Burkholderiaceae TaxID=119060 RepID=A0A1M6XQ86_9BURK|nr:MULTISPECIES: LysR family transcriptional regulator [Paraburkholderia]ORC45744.1 LysR family transcriptional regulator [Burkholderia sp. A27]SDP30565.1 DNA-binding transcriptional regulator, LysR family [Paraburkholderia sediminicola]SHL08114.1 DNA-binding transcriptional regulator, LysR family [Paraburkholderia terricola]